SQNEDHVNAVRHGLVLTCVGDQGHITYKKSRRGDAEIDRAMAHVLKHSGRRYDIENFSPYGYDERQYCSPGFNLPVGCFMRTPHRKFLEYHSSADNLELMDPASLAHSLMTCLSAFYVLENNRWYCNQNPKCEPQLGRRGLYRAMGGDRGQKLQEAAMLWVLNQSDGEHTLLDIAERRMKALQPVAEQASNGSVCYQADLRLDSDIAALVANLKLDVKGVDILVHSAGVIRLSPFECASPDQLDWHYKVNLRAPYLLTQGLLPMIKARQGQIVFVNSTACLRAGANASQYASTKHALRAVADSLRDEVNAAGIRVLSLFLGRTARPMQASVDEMEHRKDRQDLVIQQENVAGGVMNALRLRRQR